MELRSMIAALCLLFGLNGRAQEVPILINHKLFIPFGGINSEITTRVTKQDIMLVRKLVKKKPTYINDTLMQNLYMVKIYQQESKVIDAVTALQFDLIPRLRGRLFTSNAQSFLYQASNRSLTYKRIRMFKNELDNKLELYLEYLPKFISKLPKTEKKMLIKKFDQVLEGKRATEEERRLLWWLGKSLSIIGHQKATDYVIASIELAPDNRKAMFYQQLKGLKSRYLTNYFIDRFFELSINDIEELNKSIEFNSIFSLLENTVEEFRGLYSKDGSINDKIKLRAKLEKRNYHFLEQIN